MSVRIGAALFGLVMLFVGVAGFMPNFTTADGHLFGIFMVNTMHNFVHIATGIVALLVCMNAYYAKWYFRIFGLSYLLVAILGFVNHGDVMGMQMSFADNALHVGIALVALYFGFLLKKSTTV